MNMMKPNKYTYILFVTVVIIFLFGCSAKQQQKAPVDVNPELSSEEIQVQKAVVELAEETKEVERIKEVNE